jgi:pyruvate/2-oxoglutarate dehydrogenase complex dihydrolipoamide dehydrogenase (E3) component
MEKYDFVVIGGGSAGFNAARTAVALGLKVAVVDGARRLGGLCILRGCMPSKTLLYSAEVLQRAREGRELGLRIRGATADMAAIHRRKVALIGDFARYRTRQLGKGDFALIRASARFDDPHTLVLSNGRRIAGRRFLIATGSTVAVPGVPGLAESGAWTSDEVLELARKPASVIVLGGGVVACELAQYLRRIGSRVVLIQRSSHILRTHSEEAATVVEDAFRDEGIEVLTGTRLESVHRAGRDFVVTFEHRGRRIRRRARHCLNALGRIPLTAGLGLGEAGVRTRDDGGIVTNRWQQTSAGHIYAAGDCSGPVEIVHVAIQQGELAARHAAGVKGLKPVDYSLLLSVVFTDPQVASIGLSGDELKRRRIRHVSASYPFDDHGKSIVMNATRGHVRVFAEPRRGRILGAEVVGRDAGELIHVFNTGLAMRATVVDMLRAPWYHPTLSEIVTYPLEVIADSVGGT